MLVAFENEMAKTLIKDLNMHTIVIIRQYASNSWKLDCQRKMPHHTPPPLTWPCIFILSSKSLDKLWDFARAHKKKITYYVVKKRTGGPCRGKGIKCPPRPKKRVYITKVTPNEEKLHQRLCVWFVGSVSMTFWVLSTYPHHTQPRRPVLETAPRPSS